MGFIGDWLRFISGIDQFNALKMVSDEYRHKLEQQEKIIAELKAYRDKPENDGDSDLRYEREREAHMQLIECSREKRDLKERIIFLEYELKKLKQK